MGFCFAVKVGPAQASDVATVEGMYVLRTSYRGYSQLNTSKTGRVQGWTCVATPAASWPHRTSYRASSSSLTELSEHVPSRLQVKRIQRLGSCCGVLYSVLHICHVQVPLKVDVAVQGAMEIRRLLVSA